MTSGKAKPELLSPAGSPESLEAAVKGGCDAVYMGGRLLNARMRAKNFGDDDMKRAISDCHKAGVRVYVTLNTIVFDRELDEALRYAAFLYESGCDALIIADTGLSALIRRNIPDFPLHASTQMSGHNSRAARCLSEAGFSRMVAARELPERELSALIKASPIETEVFIHGAFCVSHSGQCLMSWAMGGRSGNRGQCAQPCRMSYNGGYPLSLKDNCLAPHITSLIEMGAASLKIEGRLKPPSYVYAVTSIYRRLLDEGRDCNPDELKRLGEIFSRGGFTDGYFTSHIGKAMLGVRGDERVPECAIKPVKYPRTAIETRSLSVEIPPDAAQRPPKAPLKRCLSARFYNPAAIGKSSEYFDIIYLPLDKFKPLNAKCTGVLLPPVIYDGDAERVKALLQTAYQNGARHALVGNIGHISLCKESVSRDGGYILHGDYRLNAANSHSCAFYGELGGFEDIILSPELILPQIRDINAKKSVIVYGQLPLMTLEKPISTRSLRDTRGADFPVIRDGERDIIVNSVPIYMADRDRELLASGVYNRHFVFTTEAAAECEYIISAYKNKLPPKSDNIKRIK